MCRTLAIILLLLLGALPGGLAHAVNTNPHSCVDIFGHGQSVHAQAAAPSLPSGQAQSGPKTTAPSPRTAKNASPSTTDKVKDAVHSTIDAIKRFFGFKKPSRDPKDPQEALQKESQSTRERGSSSQEGQGQPGGPGEPGDGASTSSQQQQGSQGQAKQAQSQPSPQSQLLEQNDSQYQVTNKDVTNQVKDGKNTPNYAIGTTADVPMSRLRESIYENLGTPLRKMPHLRTPEPPSQPSSKVSPQASKSFLINEQGARTLVIGKPYGKRPVLAQYQDFRVRASTPGEYVVESLNSNPLPKDIYFWLENEPPEVLNPQQIFELTRKSAIAQQQWPTHIHDGIQYARKNGGQDPRKVAQSLSRWFQKDGGYVYYTDPNASGPDGSAAPASKEQIPMDPLGLAQAKTFNCDGGAQLGAILLRDFFNLPTRVVDGRPIAGSKVINNERYNVANINVPRHAWVEVWMNNEWVPFDFTPAQDNPENEPQKDQLDPAEDPTENDDSNDDENADKSGQEQDQDTDSDDDSSSDTSDQPRSSDKKSSRDGKSSKLKSESEANSDSASDPKSKESESNPRQQSKKSDGSKKQERSKDESQSDQKKDAQKFPSKAEQKTTPNKPQTQNKSNPQPSNPNSKDSQPSENQAAPDVMHSHIAQIPKSFDSLIGSFSRQASLQVLEKGVREVQVQDLRLTLEAQLLPLPLLANFNQKAKMDIGYIADSLRNTPEYTIQDLLSQAKTLTHKDPTQAYALLKQVRLYVDFIAKYRALNFYEDEFKRDLDKILKEFLRYNHRDAGRHATVERVLKGLPGDIIKKILLDQFPQAQTPGSIDQANFYNALVSGNMSSIVRASLVGRHFNFLLNAEREHRFRYSKSILRAYQRQKKNDGIVLARPEDIAKFERWVQDFQYHPNPTMMLLGNLIKDQQYMMGYRQLVPGNGSRAPIERKHTNVFFDVSGSMGWAFDPTTKATPADIQSSAIAAIVDKALSEKDPVGNPIHEVILFPFGSYVHGGVHVTSAEQAKRVVLEYLSKPTPSNDGTDIQACFDMHFEMMRKHSGPQTHRGSLTGRLKLKKANMILLTDGGSYIDKDKILRELKALPEDLKTVFNLVAIGERNSALEEVVQFTNTQNSKSMVTVLTPDMMSSFIKDSKVTPTTAESDAFVFDEHRGELAPDLIRRVSQLTLPSFATSIPTDQLRAMWQQISGSDQIDPQINATLIQQLDGLIKALNLTPVDKDFMTKVAYDILSNYPRWSGRKLNELSSLEAALLKRLQKLTEK